MAKLIYNEISYELSNGVSVDTALNALKMMYPELSNATVTLNEYGDYIVSVATATKGAGNVIYGAIKVSLSGNQTPEEVKDRLSLAYPELKNATITINEDGDFELVVATATKGM